jgi:hypothetical protein
MKVLRINRAEFYKSDQEFRSNSIPLKVISLKSSRATPKRGTPELFYELALVQCFLFIMIALLFGMFSAPQNPCVGAGTKTCCEEIDVWCQG